MAKMELYENLDSVESPETGKETDVLASFVDSRRQSWARARSEQESNWLRWYRQWRMKWSSEDKTVDSEKSQLKMPATREAVRMAVDAIMAVVFSVTPVIDLESRVSRDHEEVEAIQKYIEFLIENDRVESKIGRMVQGAAIYGTGFIVVEPKPFTEPYFDTEEVPAIGPDGMPTLESKRVYKETTIVRPSITPVSIWDCWVPPTALDVDTCEGIITRSVQSKAALKKLERAGVIKNVDLLGKSVGPTSRADTPKGQIDRLQLSGITAEVVNANEYEVYVYRGYVDNELLEEAGLGPSEDGGMEMVITVCNSVTLSAIPNPYINGKRNIIAWPFERVEGEFYGMGVCEVAEGPQRGLDATIRSRMDNRAITAVPQFAINTRTFVDGQDLKSRPGKTWLFDGPTTDGDIRQLNTADVSETTHRDVAEFLQFIQSSHGISPLIGGMPSKTTGQTAYEVGVLAQQASGRIRSLCSDLEAEVIQPLAEWFFAISSQFLNVDEILTLTDYNADVVETMNVPVKILQGSFMFKAKGAAAVALSNRLGKIMQFLGQTSNPVDLQLVNRPYLLRKAYEGLGFNDANQAFNQPAAAASITPGAQTPAQVPMSMPGQPGIQGGPGNGAPVLPPGMDGMGGGLPGGV